MVKKKTISISELGKPEIPLGGKETNNIDNNNIDIQVV